MDSNATRLLAALQAAVAAGPVFVFSLFAARLYLLVPAPVTLEPISVAQFFLVLVLALLVGSFLAFVPALIGTLAMSAFAERWESARSGTAWAAAGAISGGGIALLFDAAGSTAFALVATSGVCALIARRGEER